MTANRSELADRKPDGDPDYKRVGVRVGLVVSVAIVIALEFTRTETEPPQLEQQSVAAATTNAIPIGPVEVGFDRLGEFEVKLPPAVENADGLYVQAQTSISNQIPADILALNGRQVLISGFMQPMTMNKGKVTEFLLYRDRDTCCFGGVPAINHWIGVKLTNAPTAAKLGRPITVRGHIKVGEIRSEGFLVGLYTMEADQVTDAEP